LRSLTYKADLWALGALMYEMATGKQAKSAQGQMKVGQAF
jgi:serine/threonine protein kinase